MLLVLVVVAQAQSPDNQQQSCGQEGHDLQVLSEVVDLARSIARSDAMAGVVDAELSPSGTAFAADGSEARSEEMLRFLCAHTTRFY